MKFKIIKTITTLSFLCLTISDARPETHENANNFVRKCGYEGCPPTPKNKLNIHLVPHTHDDVGWLKTVDQYYYGAKPLTQKASVETILDSVVAELLKDPSKRFIYVESAFFFKWWPEQSEKLQAKVIELVNEGRLEFIGGAWSMNDEATTHYQSLIDQFSYGLKKLNDTFGKCGRPRVGWQIDPFGHSKEMASIFAGMGFDGMFFARLDWRDKTRRLDSKTAEMIWHASESLGKDADLFTGILRNHYSAPPGFCFDYLCNDEPIIDDGYERNVEKRLDVFYNYVKNMTKYYDTNNIMIPMGDDFNFQDASMYFKNIDKLIKYSKDRKVNDMEVNIFYSTPSCYLKSLNEAGKDWPSENNDFFPYATDKHTYWAGYYTSRPTLKRYERIGNNVLQVCKKLLAANLEESTDNLNFLREIMGVMQHHDAITGTEKQHVADDYAYLLYNAIKGCDQDIEKMLTKILKVDQNINKKLEFQPCHKLNESSCDISESNENFMITIINPMNKETSEYIRIPVHDGAYKIKDINGTIIPNKLIIIPEPVRKIPGRFSTALYEMVFKAEIKDITSFYVEKEKRKIKLSKNLKKKHFKTNRIPRKVEEFEKSDVENSKMKLFFENGLLVKIYIKDDAKEHNFRQEFLYFEGAAGNNAPPFENRSSGAYIYRPRSEEKDLGKKVKLKIFELPNKSYEVQQIFNDWVSQVIRIYENSDYIEFEWLVGPIPVTDQVGKEIITRFTTSIKSNTFYTDSNGREMIKRIYNEKEKDEPMPANYYPITTKLAVEDKTYRMSILTDRAQGGSCLKPGQCEILVHRRLLHDDAFGVGEALNETTVARGKLFVLFDKKQPELISKERDLQLSKLSALWPVFSKLGNVKFEEWQNLDHTTASNIINAQLPSGINLLTFEPFGKKKYLIRLENYYEVEAGGKTIEFDLKKFGRRFNAKSFDETTLDGNQWLKQTHRMTWNTKEENKQMNVGKQIILDENELEEQSNITLKPMQIRTYIMSV